MRDYPYYGTSVLLRFCCFIVQHFFSFNRIKPGQKVLPLPHMMCTDTAAVEQWKIGRGQQRPTDMNVVDGGHECGWSFPVCWRHVIFEIGHWLRCRMLWTGWTTVSAEDDLVSRALPWCYAVWPGWLHPPGPCPEFAQFSDLSFAASTTSYRRRPGGYTVINVCSWRCGINSVSSQTQAFPTISFSRHQAV